MKTTTWAGLLTAASALAPFPAPAVAQHDPTVKLHINPRWSQCSFQLDSSLTQGAWRQFTREAGLVTYFRPLTSAEPMGAGSIEISLLQWKTGIDDHDAAWNDTFVHPDSAHWLFEGSGLAFPGLTVRAGITNRTDVGAYITKSFGANYGFYGAQVQHNLVRDAGRKWAAAARVSFVSMYGPEDVDFTVYGVDFVASRKIAFVSPYVGVAASLSRSHEKSSAVDLDDESVLGAQAVVGAVAQLSMARIGIEYGVAAVPSFSLKVGMAWR